MVTGSKAAETDYVRRRSTGRPSRSLALGTCLVPSTRARYDMTGTQRTGSRAQTPARDPDGYGRAVPYAGWPRITARALLSVVNYEEGAEYGPGDESAGSRLTAPTYAFPPGVSNLRLESDYRVRQPRRASGASSTSSTQERDPDHRARLRGGASSCNPDVGQAMPRARLRVRAHGWRWEEPWTLTAGRGTRPHPARGRLARAHVRHTPERLVLPLRPEPAHAATARRGWRLPLRLERLQRRPPVLRRRRRSRRHLVVPYSGVYNDGTAPPRSLDDPEGFLALLRQAVDQHLREGETRPEDDDDRTAPATRRAGRTEQALEQLDPRTAARLAESGSHDGPRIASHWHARFGNARGSSRSDPQAVGP